MNSCSNSGRQSPQTSWVLSGSATACAVTRPLDELPVRLGYPLRTADLDTGRKRLAVVAPPPKLGSPVILPGRRLEIPPGPGDRSPTGSDYHSTEGGRAAARATTSQGTRSRRARAGKRRDQRQPTCGLDDDTEIGDRHLHSLFQNAVSQVGAGTLKRLIILNVQTCTICRRPPGCRLPCGLTSQSAISYSR